MPMHVSWVKLSQGQGSDHLAGNVIKEVLGGEAVTTSGGAAGTAAGAPVGTTDAIVWANGVNLYVQKGAGSAPTASAANGVAVPSGTLAIIAVMPDDYIGGVEV